MPRLRHASASDREGLARELQLAQHLELALGAAGRLDLVRRLRRVTADQRLGAEGLELHRVGAGARRDLDEAMGQRGIAVVIHAGLGDEEDRRAGADGAAGDRDRRAHRDTPARARAGTPSTVVPPATSSTTTAPGGDDGGGADAHAGNHHRAGPDEGAVLHRHAAREHHAGRDVDVGADPRVVLDDGAAVQHGVDADRDAGAQHDVGEDHGAGLERGGARHDGARMHHRRGHQRAERVEHLGPPGQRAVAEADQHAVDAVTADEPRHVVVATEHVGPAGVGSEIGEAGHREARGASDLGHRPRVAAGAQDEDASAAGPAHRRSGGIGARPAFSTTSARRNSHSVSIFTEASQPISRPRLSWPMMRP